jgi:hypothetical protein
MNEIRGGMDRNPYSPPKSPVADVEVPLDPPATPDELKAFFGESDGYYLDKWLERAGSSRFFVSFNWAAFFFGMNWCLYRRLWKAAAVCLLAAFALGLTLSRPSALVGLLVCRIVLGLVANAYYLATARTILVRTRSESRDSESHLGRLQALGGTSVTAVVVSSVIAILLTAVTGARLF